MQSFLKMPLSKGPQVLDICVRVLVSSFQNSERLSDVKINIERAGHVARIENKEMRTKFCFNHVQKGNYLGDRNVDQRVTSEMDIWGTGCLVFGCIEMVTNKTSGPSFVVTVA